MDVDIICDNFYTRITRIVENLEEFTRNTEHFQGQTTLPITHIVHMVDSLCRDVLQVYASMPLMLTETFVTQITNASRVLHRLCTPEQNEDFSYESSVTRTGLPGRPKYEISYSQLEVFLEAEFSVKEIGKLLSVSERTVKYKMEEYGLSLRDMYSTMDDDLLDSMVSRALTLFPSAGYKMVQGYLSSEGVRVQRYRIRNSLHRLDPMRQSLRRVTAIKRRAYKVASPLALWHIDGNHKLIRWRFVIHGGVDGYSRTVVYLTANTDNLSKTVLVAFRKAVEDWGLPSRVRGDMGVENRDVASFMLEHLARGPGRGSFITGRSVHNTRIERLWRDVYTGVLATFYNVFMHLESIGVLDPLDEVDVFCLHMTYLPKINASLQKFQETWNHHKIRSAGNKTPVQLFMLGMQDIAYQNGVVAKEYFEDLNETSAAAFGIDNEESLTFEEEENAVNIPHSDVTVTSEQRRHIMSLTAVDSDAFDFDSYVQVRNYLKS